MKYIFLAAACCFILITNAILSYHIIVLYAYPILVASLYFNKRLTNIAIIATVLTTVLSQILNFFLEYVDDWNHPTLTKLFVMGILPRSVRAINGSRRTTSINRKE